MVQMKSTTADVKLVAFYLPQFHPIPENDQWWGKGFTEWTNVTKATPLFAGHYQPHLPSDLGFYDLRVGEVMHEQMQLAQANGIDAFCYHYYWFSGKRLLERPLDEMLGNPELDMPFCLCWANESWTRRWDGAESQVLMSQRYAPEDDLEFIRGLEPFLRDSRYLKVGDAPILIVYRPQQMPDPLRSTEAWRRYCRESGIGEIHLCAALTHGNQERTPGFDSTLDFPPHNATGLQRITNLDFSEPFAGNVTDFVENARYFLGADRAGATHFRTVFPSWDNTARRATRANVIVNATPANYEFWLAESIRLASAELPYSKRLVFINAWNEWAEGCHLEPDRRHGHAFLGATLRARQGTSVVHSFADQDPAELAPSATPGFSSQLKRLIRHQIYLSMGQAGNALKRYPRLRRMARWILRKG